MATPSDNLLREAAELAEAGREFVLITVVRTQGSTPRPAGARMIWLPDGSGFPNGCIGTVGGGQFEQQVIEAARERRRQRGHAVEKFVLGADADQCCGGTMEVFLEHHPAPATLVLFGAGHVAHAAAEALAFAGLRIAVVDDRREWNSEARFPRALRVHGWEDGAAVAHAAPGATIALVMTCSHDTDFELLRLLLQDGRTPPAVVGLIGSRSKRACLFTRLLGAGVAPERVERIVCPIGVGDTGKEPRAIAVSIAAQVLMEVRRLAGA